jgi:hypothetical protein
MVFIRKGVLTKNALARYSPLAIPVCAVIFGSWLNRYLNEGYRSFHNRSALYGGRDLKPGERIW